MPADSYQGRAVVVTGGLGFIGSNLAVRLANAGARVTVIDSSVPGCGANAYNLAPVADRVRVVAADLTDASQFRAELEQAEVIFNLAGEISHIHSMQFPERDLQLNTLAQLRFLLECAAARRGIRIVYASTRQIYGAPDYLPVDEKHPIRPIDFNGIHKAAACMYHLMLSRTGELDAVVLRLTNVYGPRMALNVPAQGFLSTYLRRALLAEPLEIFGTGAQLRDPAYVDDVVDAFLLAGSARVPSRTYNIGGPQGLSLRDIAMATSEAAGGLPLRQRPFPEDVKPIDIGSYETDCSLALRELGWRPRVLFAEGIARTLRYYQPCLAHYLPTRKESLA